MALEIRDLLRVHTCAFNGRDLETFAAQAVPNAACICDGKWVGEGPDGVRRLLEAEYALNADVIGRMEQHRGEDVIAEFAADGVQRRGTLRIRGDSRVGRIHEMRIEHNGPVVTAGVPEPAV